MRPGESTKKLCSLGTGGRSELCTSINLFSKSPIMSGVDTLTATYS